MTQSYSVGDEVDSWCTKCKMELAHTIVAIVDNFPKKVKCNTCNGQHNYRPKSTESKPAGTRRAPRRLRTPEAIFNEHVAQLPENALSNSRKYSIGESYSKDEVIRHARFGTGIVLSVINDKKIEVIFESSTKLLIQNQEV
jgi:hypothetical protein